MCSVPKLFTGFSILHPVRNPDHSRKIEAIVTGHGVNQCHLLRKVIRKNIFNNSMDLVYLRIHLKSWGFCFS